MNSFSDLKDEYLSFRKNTDLVQPSKRLGSTAQTKNQMARNSRGEQLRGNVGELMFNHINQFVISRNYSRYDPHFYNNGSKWSTEEKQELASELIASTLLGDGKIDYLFDVTEDIESLNKLLNEMLRRILNKRLQKTLATNVITRLKKKLKYDKYEAVKTPTGNWYRPVGSDHTPLEIEDLTFRALIEEIRKIPRIPYSQNSVRATSIWSTAAFNELVDRVLEGRGGLYLRDFDNILKEVLTDSLPKTLNNIDDNTNLASDDVSIRKSNRPNLVGGYRGSEVEGAYEEIEMRQFITQYANKLDDNEVAVLALKGGLALSDSELIPYLKVSRPTVQKIRENVYSKIQNDLSEFSGDSLRAATYDLVEACSLIFANRDL